MASAVRWQILMVPVAAPPASVETRINDVITNSAAFIFVSPFVVLVVSKRSILADQPALIYLVNPLGLAGHFDFVCLHALRGLVHVTVGRAWFEREVRVVLDSWRLVLIVLVHLRPH